MSNGESPEIIPSHPSPLPYFQNAETPPLHHTIPRKQPVQVLQPNLLSREDQFTQSQPTRIPQQYIQPLPGQQRQPQQQQQHHQAYISAQQISSPSRSNAIPLGLLGRWPATVDCPVCGQFAL